ncbi:Glutamyl-tRNA reductase-binding protein [Hibiscus syriacus]|uniref:Glutamyl-tRNA reductase-binding protein n=1 Tax=Hibiscus syriacus TaxID=106335 RepID=A0A6A2XKD1_HIBSY|nr:Glutamyl-tRNA reductase-binding protein [Hibiscus syriacus]
MELSSIGTLSTLAQDGWPLGVGVRFAVDAEGTPVLRLLNPSLDNRSTLHAQLEQCGLRSPQCTIQGNLNKPADATILRRFGEEADVENLYIVDVQRVLQMEDFNESEAKMIWVDHLGFDLRIYSPQNSVFDVRIPFPREVTDEKGAKFSFNGMSQLAWEVEKIFQAPDFEKVKQLKRITYSGML